MTLRGLLVLVLELVFVILAGLKVEPRSNPG